MNSNHVFTVLLCITFFTLHLFTSCSSKTQENQEADTDNVPDAEITLVPVGFWNPVSGDSAFYTLQCNSNHTLPNNLYLQIHSYNSDNSHPTTHIIPLSKGSPYACGKEIGFLIPNNAAWITVSVISDSSMHTDMGMHAFPVTSHDGVPVPEAALYALASGYLGDTTLNYFYSERSNYPDNAVAFIAKWGYLGQSRQLSPEILRNDLDTIRGMKESDGKTVVQFIGLAFLKDSAVYAAWNKVADLRGSSVFNHGLIGAALRNACDIIEPNSPHLTGLFERIAVNNPSSYFTTLRLASGEWRRWNLKSLRLLCEDRGQDMFSSDANTLFVWIRSALSHSTSIPPSTLRQRADSLLVAVTAADVYHIRLDRDRSYFSNRFRYLLTVADAYDFLGDSTEAESLLQMVVSETMPGDAHKAMGFQRLAHRRTGTQATTDKIKLLKQGYKYSVLFPAIRDSIIADLSKIVGQDSAMKLIADIGQDTTGVQKLPDHSPAISTGNFSASLNDLQTPVILEFVSEHCAPCVKNMRILQQQEARLTKENISVILVSREDTSRITQLQKLAGTQYPYAQNAQALFNFFGVIGTPTTIRIDPGGVIRYRFEGSADTHAIF